MTRIRKYYLLLAILVLLVLGYFAYLVQRSHPPVQVEPHAREEIDRAKKR